MTKPTICVSQLVRHIPACAAKEVGSSFKVWIYEEGNSSYLCSKNEGATAQPSVPLFSYMQIVVFLMLRPNKISVIGLKPTDSHLFRF